MIPVPYSHRRRHKKIPCCQPVYAIVDTSTFTLAQGILLVNHQSVHATDVMVRLWTHEMSRVFGDRLANEAHRVMFEHMLIEAIGRSVRAFNRASVKLYASLPNAREMALLAML